MTTIARGVAIYLFLLLVFRVSGKRSLEKTTTFDFVLLLVIAEATQQGMLGQDYSLTSAALLVATLVGLDVVLSLLKQRSRTIDHVVDGIPLLLLAEGRPLVERMRRERVGAEDILAQARLLHGLERLDQIRYAVLERNGSISIVPR